MIYLYGAGGHAKVVIDILESLEFEIGGIIDDNEELSEIMGYKVYRNDTLNSIDKKHIFLISIGNNKTRKDIAEKLDYKYPDALIHPSAIVSKRAMIGTGSIVIQGSIIQAEAIIGKHCIINTGATVGHECKLSDYVHIAPNSTLCGNVQVGECTWIGAGSVIIPDIKIGKNCIVGAGAVVVKDVPDNTVYVGNPARFLKHHK
jgi:sugar O-acyltransferase (sialic acid O-acetyltransferase NeuD family)